MTTRQPPALTILCMYCTGGTEMLEFEEFPEASITAKEMRKPETKVQVEMAQNLGVAPTSVLMYLLHG